MIAGASCGGGPKLADLVWVEDTGGPVFVSSPGEHFYRDSDTAADALFDDGIDFDTAVVHPCKVEKAHTPDIREVVEEAWYSNYEDPDTVNAELPTALGMIVDGLQVLLQRAAPDVWLPRYGERIKLVVREPVH